MRRRTAPGASRQAMRRPYRIRCSTEIGSLELVFFRARAGLPAGRPADRRGAGGERHAPPLQGQLADRPSRAGRDTRGFRAEGPLRPVYPLTQGLSQRVLGPGDPSRPGRAAGAAGMAGSGLARAPAMAELRRCPALPPPAGRRRRGSRSTRRRGAGSPSTSCSPTSWRWACCAGGSDGGGRALQADGRLRQGVLAALPFRLTPAQERALAEIDADLAAPARMLRLLQGDVGSGKTLVALLAMLTAIEAGGQAALMAPTEVLARQHAATLDAAAGAGRACAGAAHRSRARRAAPAPADAAWRAARPGSRSAPTRCSRTTSRLPISRSRWSTSSIASASISGSGSPPRARPICW